MVSIKMFEFYAMCLHEIIEKIEEKILSIKKSVET